MSSPQPSEVKVGREITRLLKDTVEPKLKLQDNETKENVWVLENLLKFLVEQMKKVDLLFEFIYRHIYYTGSYYDGLRINSASEFDLNAVLALPFLQQDREIIIEKNCPAYAKYRLKETVAVLIAKMTKPPPKGLAIFFDDKNYLLPERIRSWLQSVMDKTFVNRASEVKLFTDNRENDILSIKTKGSGPARTLLIETRRGIEIDVDFVPVLKFCFPEWPKGAATHGIEMTEDNGIWFLVPKPYKKMTLSHLEPKNEDVPRVWRLHFPEVEKLILLNCGFVKPLIKCLKRLRDEENWKSLASYYLKTFVMWEVLDKPKAYWNGELGQVFLDLLRNLKEKVKAQKIPYLFYPNLNLLRGMNQREAENIVFRIDRILAMILRDPQQLLNILGCSPNLTTSSLQVQQQQQQAAQKSSCAII